MTDESETTVTGKYTGSPEQLLRQGSPGRNQAGSPEQMPAGSPGRNQAGSPERMPAGSPGRNQAGSPERMPAGSPGRNQAGSPERMPAQSPEKKQAGSPERMPAQSPEKKQTGSPERMPAQSPEKKQASNLEKPVHSNKSDKLVQKETVHSKNEEFQCSDFLSLLQQVIARTHRHLLMQSFWILFLMLLPTINQEIKNYLKERE